MEDVKSKEAEVGIATLTDCLINELNVLLEQLRQRLNVVRGIKQYTVRSYNKMLNGAMAINPDLPEEVQVLSYSLRIKLCDLMTTNNLLYARLKSDIGSVVELIEKEKNKQNGYEQVD